MRALSKEESYILRDRLLQIWGYDGLEWEPFEDKSPLKTIFIIEKYFPCQDVELVLSMLKKQSKWKLFIISTNDIDKEMDVTDFDFYLYESIYCDTTLDGVIYCSNSSTYTFGGKWLIEYIEMLFEDRKELISEWNNQ